MCMGEWQVINEQKVAASESGQEHLVARNESIPPLAQLPGELVLCFPPCTSRFKPLLLKPSQNQALTLNRNEITA